LSAPGWTAFHEAVERLPEEEREVVNLVYYDGLSRAEAAREVGVSAKTVRRRWDAALVKLHRVLKAVH
jgi:RNA polymerase sigma-70 factor (ECF subfamily)